MVERCVGIRSNTSQSGASGSLGHQGCREVGDAGVVFQLGDDGSHGAPGVDGVSVGADVRGSGAGLRSPAVEQGPHGRTVPAGQVGQALVGEAVKGAG